MTATIRLPPTLADRIGGVARVAVRPACIRDGLHELVAQHPELTRMIWLDTDELNPVILLFLNNRLLRPVNLAQALADGDELDLIPSIEAG